MAELRVLLERRSVTPEDAEAALAEVAAGGYLDDADFARRFTEDRRRLDGWGERRIARELTGRGIAAELVEATLAGRRPEDELGAAQALLEERIEGRLADDRARRRALGLLARRGYAPEVAYEAVRLHHGGTEADRPAA